jgi:Spy/CpxP family protein refolding chaperone
MTILSKLSTGAGAPPPPARTDADALPRPSTALRVTPSNVEGSDLQSSARHRRKRFALAMVAGLMTLGITAGVGASVQNTNQDPGSFNGPQGRRGGPGGPFGRGGPGGPLGPGLDGPLGLLRMLGPRLNLTDAQRDQLKSIADSHKDEWKALADRARAAHDALHDAVLADTIDDGLIRAKAADVAAVDADIAVATAHARAEAWQILTPEQKAQAKQFQTEMKNRAGHAR